ncbi:MAG TPA: DUF1330 domain-containing protein [Nocardioides bacterium]|uniref:DUF1330 domain-containing protein n=1 Tax=uncultured Nocardioides sp. TaxID=198441 RepID=UPI000ED11EE5|nr:DUF1330 domain-containing protein [uncultured Nocardioides sp.]HCB03697.1 DUF1330 domain-containing protein [Nocardioides sp.]HRD60389.1 DUF1330 domain-containing protein [Nocardioides sp.]HRK45635.1 DUF1330 domain-containing protein [Nocardioides sp.]
MTAYWISQYREISDETRMAAYAALGRPALEAAGGRFLARGLPDKLYEAGVSSLTVLIEFDSVAAAEAAHDSPAYQEALAALGDAAVRDIRIVPGLA